MSPVWSQHQTLPNLDAALMSNFAAQVPNFNVFFYEHIYCLHAFFKMGRLGMGFCDKAGACEGFRTYKKVENDWHTQLPLAFWDTLYICVGDMFVELLCLSGTVCH